MLLLGIKFSIRDLCRPLLCMGRKTLVCVIGYGGATENARPDIARLVSVLTTSLCLIQRVLYELLIGFMFVVLFLSVLLIATCGRLSWPALWTTFGRTIK